MSRLDALRALLAQHTPTPDDARIGHRYVYPAPDRTRVDLGDDATRRARAVARFLARAAAKDRERTA